MPVAQDTAKNRLAAAPQPGERAHTDSVAAFVPDQSRAERTTSYEVVRSARDWSGMKAATESV